jgi:hypothetical protein
MIDAGHYAGHPKGKFGYFQIFYGLTNGAGANGPWQMWVKPKGCHMVNILCIGGANAGNNGIQAAGGSGTGGNGGAGACVSRLIVAAALIPDVLYVSCGEGGSAGNVGAASYVSISAASNNHSNLLIHANPSTSASSATTCELSTLGVATFQAGVSGGAAGSSAGGAGGSLVPVNSGSTTCGGCGGGGTNGTTTDGAGGAYIISANVFPILAGGGAGPTGGPGNNGYTFWQPLVMCGGTGGGANGLANGRLGYNGGNGSWGCGGGGGGSGWSGGGAGGQGGPGLVIITCS